MSIAVNLIRKAGYSFAVGAMVAFCASSPAAPLALPDTPLSLSSGVQPNLIMAIDDSGSMDFETLFPGNDGSAWWRTATASGTCTAATGDSFVGCVSNDAGTSDIPGPNRLNFNNAGNANGTWKKYSYLFPNGVVADGADNFQTAGRRSGDATNDHFAIPPLLDYAWARSPSHNAAYFNPASRYVPWVNGGGYSFTNANPTAARFDPVFEPNRTLNLTQDVAGTGTTTAADCSSVNTNIANHWYFKVYTGMTLPEGTCIRPATVPDNVSGNWQEVRAGGCRVGVDGGCPTRRNGNNFTYRLDTASRVAIRYFPATFYLPVGTSLPDGYGYTGTVITGGKAPNGTAMNGYQIKSGNFASTAQYNAAMQNFANWFTYYRKRHQALRGGLGESFNDLTSLRVAGFTINDPRTVAMGSIDDTTDRNALYRNFYADWIRSGGTPNRTAVASLISNFRRTGAGAPVTAACQKNFGMLFTDGFSNSPAADDGITGVFGNVDGDEDDPYSDGVSDTMADAVLSAYNTPLRTGVNFPAGKVSVPSTCNGNNPLASLDCNSDLHMNFYAVTLGTQGLLFKPDAPRNPYASPPPPWPTAFPARHPSAVDDIWHATINGRGQLLNARSATDIAVQLKAVLRSINDATSSGASAAVSGGTISGDSLIFQPKFKSLNWTGQLLAFNVDPQSGALTTQAWDAANELPAAAIRNIVTMDSQGNPVDFTWQALQTDTTRSGQLDPDPARAQMMLEYLRGADTNEGTEAGQFRVRMDGNRPNKLGDIVSSGPLYVAAPPFRYRDSLETSPYSSFATSNANRTKAVYVGANDGMLHAFSAATGRELFAFIPSPVFSRLRNLSAQNYGHQFFVDGSPSMGDAFFGGAWRTVLAGGLNKGGQGIYALDVTNPDNLGTGSVLWEFTDADDEDLGFTYSQPAIVRLRTGWAVVFGNGYNNTLDDTAAGGRRSATGNAVLYVVDLATGAVTKLNTGVGNAQRPAGIDYDNGLATPSLVDLNGDRIVEFAYAGDLYGNMWKFDLSSADRNSWGVAFDGAPLFTARDDDSNVQPITVRPEIARGPSGAGVVVLFGTGKYLELSDKVVPPLPAPQVKQSFYGIFDRNAAPIGAGVDRSTVLTRQSILVETSFDFLPDESGGEFDIRVTSNRPAGPASQGWFMDLVSPVKPYEAEKQVSNPTVRNGAVIFTTLIPDADPCNSGGDSWIMELDLLDGSRLGASPFDFTQDGEFTAADQPLVTLPGDDGDENGDGDSDGPTKYPSSGVKSRVGGTAAPGIAEGDYGAEGKPVQYKYLSGTSGNIQVIVENPGMGGTGRQSWRQIR